ncbi:MAG: hypothetical protein MI723_12645 [Caulobacterales bacterium]|nr:hypothetical protein [Caulobacterales bacterium]
MDTLDPLLLAGAKAKGKRPYFFADQDVERLMNIVMALAGELAVTRERLDTLERVLAKSGALQDGAVETFAPTKEEAEARGRWTQEFIARILRVLQQEAEALDAKGEKSSEQVGEELAKA